MSSDGEVPFGWIEASEKLRDRVITWDEYLHHIFLRCLPRWHTDRNDDKTRRWLKEHDPFTASVFESHFFMNNLQDSTELEETVHIAERGTLPELEAKLDALPQNLRSMLISLIALLALRGRRLPLLRFCLEIHEDNLSVWPKRNLGYGFEDAANGVQEDKDPELFHIINTSYWRSWHKWREPGERDIRVTYIMSEIPLGWIEASEKLRDKVITRDEYLHNIFLHCLPQWHTVVALSSKPGPPDPTVPLWLWKNDRSAAAVFRYHRGIHQLKDSTKLEEIIYTAEKGALSELRLKIDALPEDARNMIIRLVALMALQSRNLPLLRFCQEHYPKQHYDHFFEYAITAVKEAKEPELFHHLKKHYLGYGRAWRVRDIREPDRSDHKL